MYISYVAKKVSTNAKDEIKYSITLHAKIVFVSLLIKVFLKRSVFINYTRWPWSLGPVHGGGGYLVEKFFAKLFGLVFLKKTRKPYTVVNFDSDAPYNISA